MSRLLVLCLVGACTATTTTPTDRSSTTDTGDTAGSGDPNDVDGDGYPDGVRFTATWEGEPLRCGDEVRGAGATGINIRLGDLRLFVSDLMLSGPDGSSRISPDTSQPGQDGLVTLLDFEDATGDCADAGTAFTNDLVKGTIAEGDWDTLTFTVGVPFDDNHRPLNASNPPLNEPGMWLSPQLGHRFLKVDAVIGPGIPADDPIVPIFVASADCDSDDPSTPPETPCDRPGLATISLPYDPFAAQIVAFDVHSLLGGVDLTKNTAGSPPGCANHPLDTAECRSIYAALGMQFSTGSCVDDCEDQRVFSVVSADTR